MRRFRFSSYVFVVTAIAWTYLLASFWKPDRYGMSPDLFLTVWIGGGAVALLLFLLFRWKTRG